MKCTTPLRIIRLVGATDRKCKPQSAAAGSRLFDAVYAKTFASNPVTALSSTTRNNQQFSFQNFDPPIFLNSPQRRFFASKPPPSSPFDSKAAATATTTATTTIPSKKKSRRKFIPPKAAVTLTPKARQFFKALLGKPPRPDVIGIMLNYNQASSGQPRMVFTFDFVTKDQISEEDEGVSLELLEDGTPKPPKEAMNDGLPKLYIHHHGFMKVLGCKLDVDVENVKPILYDASGNILDPNV